MAFVAIAIGGAAAVGAGASIYSGMLGADAAKEGSEAQVNALRDASRTSQAGTRDALAYLDPFRQYGLNAGASLQQALYSPEQQQQQVTQQRIALQGEVDRIKANMPQWTPAGEDDYKHRYPAYAQENALAHFKLKDAQAKLDTFEKQSAAMPQGGQGPQIQESPWYQFQADLLNRSQDRAFAARGLTGSGFEAEERRRGLIELGAGETERQFGRIKGLYDIGANATVAGANAITGNATNIANNQIGVGQAQAQGIMGVAGANANMANGIANSVTGAVGAGLNYKQFQSLINANKPAAPTGLSVSRGRGYSAPGSDIMATVYD